MVLPDTFLLQSADVTAKLHKLGTVDDISCQRSSAGVQLDISSGLLSPTAFVEIGHWKELTSLYLTQTPTTDVDLEPLKELPLRSLGLGGTKISDAGLVHLEALNKLEYLVLQNTAVSAPGIARLQQILTQHTRQSPRSIRRPFLR